MNQVLNRLMAALDAVEECDLIQGITALGWVLEKSYYSGYSAADYFELLDEDVCLSVFNRDELLLIENKLAWICLNARLMNVQGCAVWALGKSRGEVARKALYALLDKHISDGEVGYQLAIAIENVATDPEVALPFDQRVLLINELCHLGELGERVYEVTNRAIQSLK